MKIKNSICSPQSQWRVHPWLKVTRRVPYLKDVSVLALDPNSVVSLDPNHHCLSVKVRHNITFQLVLLVVSLVLTLLKLPEEITYTTISYSPGSIWVMRLAWSWKENFLLSVVKNYHHWEFTSTRTQGRRRSTLSQRLDIRGNILGLHWTDKTMELHRLLSVAQRRTGSIQLVTTRLKNHLKISSSAKEMRFQLSVLTHMNSTRNGQKKTNSSRSKKCLSVQHKKWKRILSKELKSFKTLKLPSNRSISGNCSKKVSTYTWHLGWRS
jgi:hypothetical protein